MVRAVEKMFVIWKLLRKCWLLESYNCIDKMLVIRKLLIKCWLFGSCWENVGYLSCWENVGYLDAVEKMLVIILDAFEKTLVIRKLLRKCWLFGEKMLVIWKLLRECWLFGSCWENVGYLEAVEKTLFIFTLILHLLYLTFAAFSHSPETSEGESSSSAFTDDWVALSFVSRLSIL